MKREPKEIKIDDIPFYRSLRKRTRKLYLTPSNRPRKNLNQRDTYQKHILEICIRISSLMETLRLSRFFLAERLGIPPDNNFKIKNAEFIRYHLESYFLRITTFKDLILKLFNRVYNLKVKENIGLEPNLRKMASNQNIQQLSTLLEGLSLLMKSVEPIRHKIAHGGYHEDVHLILIEAEEVNRRNGTGGVMQDHLYTETLKNLLTQNILDMYEIQYRMASFIILVYKKLYPVRKEQENQL